MQAGLQPQSCLEQEQTSQESEKLNEEILEMKELLVAQTSPPHMVDREPQGDSRKKS